MCLRGDTVVGTKATFEVVRTRVKCVLIYSKTENALLCSLPWTQAEAVSQKGQYIVATYQQQLSRLPTAVCTLKASTRGLEATVQNTTGPYRRLL